MVITHFILHLRQVAPSGTGSEGTESLQIPSIRFAGGLIGNLGVPLRSVFSEDLQPTEDETSSPGFANHLSPPVSADSALHSALTSRR